MVKNIPGYEELLATLDDESKRPPIVLSYVKCTRRYCENLTSTGICAECAAEAPSQEVLDTLLGVQPMKNATSGRSALEDMAGAFEEEDKKS